MDRSIASLDGKVAIVTGAAQGVGKGMAMGLAAFGAHIVVADRNTEAAQATAKELEHYGVQAMPFTVNVRQPSEVKAMVQATMDRFGRVDVLINNVGGTFRADFMDVSERGMEALIDINLKSVFHCTQAVAKEMIKLGHGGSIIQVTTLHVFYSGAGNAVYSACKAGLENFTRTMAVELAQHQIRVNSICPGLVETPGVSYKDRDPRKSVPLGRIATIEDMAGAAVFLASDMSAYMTGATLLLDGGMIAAGCSPWPGQG